MFLFVPLQWIHIVCQKTTKGTHKGFSCVDLPYVDVAAVLWPHNCITLGAGPWMSPPTITTTGWSLTFSVFIFFTSNGVGVLACGTSIACGGGVGVVTPSGDEAAVADLPPLPSRLPLQTGPSHQPPFGGLQQLFSWLKYNSKYFTVQHVWHEIISIWLFRCVLYCTLFDLFNMKYYVPVANFLLVSFPFIKIFSTSLSSSSCSTSSSATTSKPTSSLISPHDLFISSFHSSYCNSYIEYYICCSTCLT